MLFSLAYRAMGDDAHITMAYARNLALHGQWGLIPGEMANSATAPLNVMLIALGTLMTRQPAVAVGLVLMASLAAAAIELIRAVTALVSKHHVADGSPHRLVVAVHPIPPEGAAVTEHDGGGTGNSARELRCSYDEASRHA